MGYGTVIDLYTGTSSKGIIDQGFPEMITCIKLDEDAPIGHYPSPCPHVGDPSLLYLLTSLMEDPFYYQPRYSDETFKLDFNLSRSPNRNQLQYWSRCIFYPLYLLSVDARASTFLQH